ncbi:MAG TPA: ABC-type transport auxiliary lipoprotein family protein [Myxococcota bacterium]|nr:ABC-type transport auxiliary lipoprotein family protein [Myxococcota bacterium]
MMKVATGTTGIRLVTAMGCIVLLAILTVMSGCRTTPPRRYYTLSYPINRDNATLSRPPLHSIQLRVKPFSVGLPYDRPQIVYRQSPFEFQYYAYQLWAAKPQKMLRELVLSHLEASRLAGDVTQEYGERYPDYELSAEVLAVEEYDSGPVWYGHLEMRFQLVRFRDKIVLWTYHFDRKRKVYEKQPVYVVRALSQILAEEMEHITAELDRVISTDRNVPVTLNVPRPSGGDDETPDTVKIAPAQPKPEGERTYPGAPNWDELLIVPDGPPVELPPEPERPDEG